MKGPAGHKIIPTIHPAACLEHRDPLLRYYVLHDLERVKDEMDVDGVVRTERTLEIRPTYDRCVEYLTGILKKTWSNNNPAQALAWDIEVLNQEVCCISFSDRPEHAITIAFCDDDDLFIDQQELDIMLLIAKILECPEIPTVAHNAYFDSTFLFEHYGIRCASLHCSMVAHNLVNPDFKHSLAFLTSWYTREPYYKDQGKEIIDGLKWDATVFWEYCAKDSACCLESWQIIVHQLKELGNWETYLNQVAILPMLTYMQVRGIRMHPEAVRIMEAVTTERMDDLHKQLEEIVGRELPKTFPNSNKQLVDYFKVECKVEPYRKKEAPHNYTFDKVALSRLARRGWREAAIIGEIKADKKMLGSYIKMKTDPDKRCRGSWNAAGTRTGRCSVSQIWRGGRNKTEVTKRKVGVNTQTLPYQIKPSLLADEGFVIFDPDLSQAENRIVAYLAQCKAMMRAFEEGRDVHRMTAGLIFGIPEEDVSDEKGSAEMGGGKQSQRYWGKQSNHKLNYNNGYKAFALVHEIKEKDAYRIVEDGYHTIYPEIRGIFHREVAEELARNHNMITNLYGRTRRFQVRLAGSNLEAAYAQIPQSTVADKIIRDGMLHMYRNNLFKPVQLLNQVHDSLAFQIPLTAGWEHISEILISLTHSLEKPIRIKDSDLVIPCDMTMGLDFGSTKSPTNLQPDGLEELYEKLREEKVT